MSIEQKRKRGRQPVFSEKLGEAFVRLSGQGKTLEQISEVIGVSKRTLINWMNSNIDLMHAVKEARQMADEMVEAAMFARACGYSHPETKVFCDKGQIIVHEIEKHYPPDTAAASFWLRNRQPERWKDPQKIEHSGPEGKPIQTQDVSSLTDEQLEAELKSLQDMEEK